MKQPDKKLVLESGQEFYSSTDEYTEGSYTFEPDASYLPENEALRNSVSKNGAVISEYLPLSKPTRASFPMRKTVFFLKLRRT